MNPVLPTGPLAQAIGWALLHLVWQATLVAGLLAVALAALPGRDARLRYALSCAALALVLALGIATAARSYVPHATAAAHAGAGAIVRAGRLDALGALLPAGGDGARTLVHAADGALPRVVAAWLVGVALCSVRLAFAWLAARRAVVRGAVHARGECEAAVRRLARALGVRTAVRVLESAAVQVPSVVGMLRPAILLPASTLSGLTPAQLEMVLAHELAHIRRHDYLVNVLQSVVETLLYYHPAVWWISRQVRIEREHCCDDVALAVCGNPVQYARALTRLEELRGAALQLAVPATGGSLFDRVRRIVGRPGGTSQGAARGIAAATVLSCVAVALALSLLPGTSVGEAVARRAAEAVKDVVVRHAAAPSSTATIAGASLAAIPPDEPAPVDAERRTDAGDVVDDPGDAADETGDEPVDDESDAPDGRLTIDQLVALRVHGVTPAGIREARAMFPRASVDDIVGMHAVGATPEYVRALRAAGLALAKADEAQGCAAVGVTVERVRAWRAAGLDVRTADDAQGLAAVGVTPEFLRDVRAAGFAVRDADEAQGLAALGVTGAKVRALRDAGLAVGSAEDAQGLIAVGVTPEWVAAMRRAGVPLETAEDAQSLRALGVTPEFVRKLAAAGYDDLSVEDLQRLGASGVDGDFIREMSRYRKR